jgi:hypothetical protein
VFEGTWDENMVGSALVMADGEDNITFCVCTSVLPVRRTGGKQSAMAYTTTYYMTQDHKFILHEITADDIPLYHIPHDIHTTQTQPKPMKFTKFLL